jgi:hypothetical protein
MATSKSTNALTRAERVELARDANGMILGLAAELMRMVREQDVDSSATKHRAVLGMLATIHDLSDEIFGPVFGDDTEEVTRQKGEEISRRLGHEWGAIRAVGATND